VILFESKIPKGIEEYFLSTKSKLNIIEKKDKAEKNPFSSPTIFDLADAYAKGDKRTAWSEYEKAMRNGSAPEEIHGTLVWAAKSLWLSHNFDETTNMAMGVKPFVYRKFSKFGAAWNKEALLVALSELKHIYHKAHRGEGDLEILLEQHILSLRTK
jgi:DNA polymerase III delta subunit